MTQDVFPEIQAATLALERRISATETEITQMQETIAAKKSLVRRWRKAVSAVGPGSAPVATAVAAAEASDDEEFPSF